MNLPPNATFSPLPDPDYGERRQIPSDYPGTVETIKRMHELVKLAVQDRRLVELAQRIASPMPRRDYLSEVQAVLAYCQTELRYVRDPYHPEGLERLQYPPSLLFESGFRSGDCDDLAMCFSSLCAALGNPWAFRTVGSDPLFPRRFRHVVSLVHLDQHGWLPADPSFEKPLGWEPGTDDPRIRPTEPRVDRVVSRQDWVP